MGTSLRKATVGKPVMLQCRFSFGQIVLHCQIAAFEAIGGVPAEILYDRMKTAAIDKSPQGSGRRMSNPPSPRPS